MSARWISATNGSTRSACPTCSPCASGFGGDGPQLTGSGAADGADAVVSPEALFAVGVSVLFLLAGLAVAFKVRH